MQALLNDIFQYVKVIRCILMYSKMCSKLHRAVTGRLSLIAFILAPVKVRKSQEALSQTN